MKRAVLASLLFAGSPSVAVGAVWGSNPKAGSPWDSGRKGGAAALFAKASDGKYDETEEDDYEPERPQPRGRAQVYERAQGRKYNMGQNKAAPREEEYERQPARKARSNDDDEPRAPPPRRQKKKKEAGDDVWTDPKWLVIPPTVALLLCFGLVTNKGAKHEWKDEVATGPFRVGAHVEVTSDRRRFERECEAVGIEMQSWKLGMQDVIEQVDADGSVKLSSAKWVPVKCLEPIDAPVARKSGGSTSNRPANLKVGERVRVTSDIGVLERACKEAGVQWPNTANGQPQSYKLGKEGVIEQLDMSDGTAKVSDIKWVPIKALEGCGSGTATRRSKKE